mmetsp:Transcript_16872/g.39609  ORF Transcript_16872/g.39609 Transcript_16872/m.39609 type:complete len:550 (-) Transcript_16872:52-1701(-)
MPLLVAWARFLPWLAVVPSATASCVDTPGLSDIRKYHDECLHPLVYDKKLKPPSDGPLNVEVQFYLAQLNQIDQINGFVTVGGYFRLYWTDTRLAFNGSLLPKMALKTDEDIWVPDIYVDNLVEFTNPSDSFSSTKLVDVFPDGSVMKSEMALLKLKCVLEFGKIPFDVQSCHILAASYSEDTTVLRVFPRGGTPGTGTTGVAVKGPSIRSLVYEFEKDEVFNNPGTVDSIPQIGGAYWDYVYMPFDFKRRPQYYTTLVIVPSILFLGVSYTGFWVSPKAVPARATVAVIPLLILLTLMNNVYSSLPQTSEIMWLVWYLLIDLFLALLAAVEFAGVQLLLEREGIRQEHLAMLKSIEPVVKTIRKEAKRRGLSTLDLLAKIKEDGHKALEDIKVEVDPAHPMHAQAGAEGEKKVTEADVAVIEFVEDIFESYDRDKSGKLNCQEVRKAMTYFNIWLCKSSVSTVMCMFLRDYGETTPEREDLCSMRFGQFMQFLMAIHGYLLKVYSTRNLYQSFVQQPPSVRCDIIFRFAFPVLVLLVNIIMFALESQF